MVLRRLRAVLVLLLCLPCLAQTVRVENLGPPFAGWVRTTIDRMPAHESGRVGAVDYVVGRQVGIDIHVVDLHVALQPGQELAVDLGAGTPSTWTRASLPADPVAWFGGPVSCNGTPMQWVGLQADGAGYSAHFRGRTGRMLDIDLWATWYPDQPAWCSAEAVVDCSNPAVPDMGEVAPDVSIQFGDAITIVPGRGAGVPIIAAGTPFADGQARAMPLSFVWLRHLNGASVWSSVGCQSQLGIAAVGIGHLLAEGNPVYPSAFRAHDWAASLLPEAVRRVHTWDIGVCGPNKRSGDTGAQEDEVFVRGEALLAHGAPAAIVAYLSALKMANRPCHHLEVDGRQVDVSNHQSPRFIEWDGRPHYSVSVSPDQLGKLRALQDTEASGWYGPDVEHELVGTLIAGARLSGSPACQWIISDQARLYLAQWTTTPGWSTSHANAARAVGWECILAVRLWTDLEDRPLAARVKAHWLDRWNTVLRAELTSDLWDVRIDDPRLGAGAWWIPWQQSVGSYGLDLAGWVFGVPEARTSALHAAQRVVADAWVQDAGRWKSRAQMPVAGGGPADEAFDYFGMSLAAAIVRQGEPTNAKAIAIWNQLQNEVAQPTQASWLAPGPSRPLSVSMGAYR